MTITTPPESGGDTFEAYASTCISGREKADELFLFSFIFAVIFFRLDDTRLIVDLTRLDFCIPFDCTHLVFPLDYGRLVAPLALPLAFPGRVPAVRCFPRSLSARHPRSTSNLPPSKFTPTARDPGPPALLGIGPARIPAEISSAPASVNVSSTAPPPLGAPAPAPSLAPQRPHPYPTVFSFSVGAPSPSPFSFGRPPVQGVEQAKEE
jgi:hypothetical protein